MKNIVQLTLPSTNYSRETVKFFSEPQLISPPVSPHSPKPLVAGGQPSVIGISVNTLFAQIL